MIVENNSNGILLLVDRIVQGGFLPSQAEKIEKAFLQIKDIVNQDLSEKEKYDKECWFWYCLRIAELSADQWSAVTRLAFDVLHDDNSSFEENSCEIVCQLWNVYASDSSRKTFAELLLSLATDIESPYIKMFRRNYLEELNDI